MNKPTPKHLARTLKVALLITGAAVLALGLAFVVWLQSLSFQAYKPGKLPSGLSIAGRNITISKQGGGPGGAYFKTVTYLTNRPGVSIAEQKSSPSNYAGRLFHCSEPLTNATCVTHTSAQHQTYSVQTTFDVAADGTPGQPFDQTVSWLRGDTLIWITLQGKQEQGYDAQSWGDIIDAFEAANYGLEFTHIQTPLEPSGV